MSKYVRCLGPKEANIGFNLDQNIVFWSMVHS